MQATGACRLHENHFLASNIILLHRPRDADGCEYIGWQMNRAASTSSYRRKQDKLKSRTITDRRQQESHSYFSEVISSSNIASFSRNKVCMNRAMPL
jgi:hypothetical protein